MFAERGMSASVWIANSGGEVAELARRAVIKNPLIVAAGGGDGTISCVAAQIVDSDITLGVLPMGTLNHFAKDLGIPLVLEDAVDTIARGDPAQTDVGEVNGRIFLNNSSLGLYPRLVRERERMQDGGAGKAMAFVRATGAILQRYSHIEVRLDAAGEGTRSRVTPFVFIGNNQYRTQGWNIGTRERLDGGKLWICLAPRRGPFGLFMLAAQALFGKGDSDSIDAFEAPECWIETRRRRIYVATDGEVTRMNSPLHYRIRPGALRVMTPAAKSVTS